MAPHSTQRRRRRDLGGKGTSRIFRLIQPCSYFLSEPPPEEPDEPDEPDDVPVVDVVVGVDEVDDVEVVVALEVDVLSDAVVDEAAAPDFLLPYRSAPQPPPFSTKELLLTRRFIFPFAPHFSHFVGGPSPIFWRTSMGVPHFSHSYS